VSVTLSSDPGARSLSWVEITPGTGFRVFLTPGPPPGKVLTTFTFFVHNF
jgi:hypothetical protein